MLVYFSLTTFLFPFLNTFSSIVWKMMNNTGTMKSRAIVPMNIPPIVPTPNERFPLAPTPLANANGNNPKIIVMDVIRMGRRRR